MVARGAKVEARSLLLLAAFVACTPKGAGPGGRLVLNEINCEKNPDEWVELVALDGDARALAGAIAQRLPRKHP